MSEENVALARQYYAALNAEGVTDATQHLRHPDIEVFEPPDFPDADRYVGEAAVRKMIEGYLELGWDGQFRVQEYLDAGEEVVVIWHTGFATPHGGGFPVEQTFAHVLLFEDGKVRRVRQYMSRAEALEAAGLSE
jgi:ketosteroid isomerase-like protein